MRIGKGLKAFGGFILGANHSTVATVPDYPQLLRFIGDGALLSLQGERRVSLVSRNVANARLEIARVLPEQLQHLAFANQGSYTTPYLEGIEADDLVERVIGTARLNPKEATPANVHAATLAVREAWEREEERAQVGEMLEGLGSGWSLNGLDPTLRALSRGQVRTLLVHADASEPGFRCGDSGRLTRSERECRGEGEPVPVSQRLVQAVSRMGFLGPAGVDGPDVRVRTAGRWVGLSAPYGVAWQQSVKQLTVMPIGSHPNG